MKTLKGAILFALGGVAVYSLMRRRMRELEQGEHNRQAFYRKRVEIMRRKDNETEAVGADRLGRLMADQFKEAVA